MATRKTGGTQMTDRLSGKVAIVTGGGTGIGEAICRRFAQEGASVIVNGLPGDPLDDVVAEVVAEDGRATAFAGDVSNEREARACVATAIERFGKLDVLVNNAGVLLVNAQTQDMPVDKFDEQLRCNVRAAFLMTKLAGREARTPPPDRMRLRHTHDGNRNKDLVKLQ
jgi:NAD(P)-dependent dehydrogenase (short-subunit alcohol dehydrogenase family)